MYLKRIKRCIPHLRVLPEDTKEDEQGSTCNSTATGTSLVKDSNSVEVNEGPEFPVDVLQPGMPYELRDEAGRSWAKFFYEYEYRVNLEYIKSKRWYQFVYPNHTTQSPAERTLLYKLDMMIGLYFLLLCWCTSLDLNNFYNTYVSGMEKDLGMKGNDFSNTSSLTKAASVIFQLPFIYLLPRFPANYLLSFMALGWTVFTVACSFVQTKHQLVACRVLVSAFGAAYYPVSQYIIGAWYAPDEMASRVLLFFYGQLLGGVTSGLLQARIFKSLHNSLGIAGWRWMYFIDGLAISLPTVIIGFFVIPGVPSKCYSLFLTDEEIRMARLRNKRNQIKDGVENSQLQSLLSLKFWKKVLYSPTLWILLVFDLCSWNCMVAFNDGFGLWLKSKRDEGKYSTVQVNNLSTLPACLGFAFVFICSTGADFFRCRWFFLVLANFMNCLCCALLIKWDLSVGLKWFAFLMSYWSVAASPCLWSFINDYLRFDPQVKAASWIIIYSVSQSSYAGLYSVFWKTKDAPTFKTGYISSLAFSAIYGCWTFVVLYFYKRYERRRALGNGIILYDSSGLRSTITSKPVFVETHMVKKGEYYYLKE